MIAESTEPSQWSKIGAPFSTETYSSNKCKWWYRYIAFRCFLKVILQHWTKKWNVVVHDINKTCPWGTIILLRTSTPLDRPIPNSENITIIQRINIHLFLLLPKRILQRPATDRILLRLCLEIHHLRERRCRFRR